MTDEPEAEPVTETPEATPASEARTIGPYALRDRLARGPMGSVYAAVDTSTDRPVTLMLLPRALARDATRLGRFQEGVQALATLRHRNVARVLDHGREGDQAYYVMEHRTGTTLDKLLARRRLSLREAFAVFKQVALGLEAAHAAGVVHRDLNPRNVLVAEDLREVALSNFGIGFADARARERQTLTSSLAGVGALDYMAPELADDSAAADARSDIYSLGVLLYEMLIGTVPVGRFSLPSRANSEVPAEIDPLVLRCLERDPAARYPSVAAVLRDAGRLEDRLRLGLMRELEGLGRTFKRPAPTSGRGRKAAVILATAAAIAVAAFAAWSWLERRAGPGPDEPPAPPTQPAVSDRGAPEEAAAPSPPRDAPAARADATPPAAPTPPPRRPAESTGAASLPTVEPEVTEAEEGVEEAAEEAARRLFEQAEVSARQGEPDRALGYIEELVAGHPDADLSIEALFLRARVEEAQDLYEDAMDTYSRIGGLAGDTERRARARYRFARAALESGVPNREQLALGAFDEIARAYPQTTYAPLALAAQAALEEAGEVTVETAEFPRPVPAALLTSIRLAGRYPDSPAAERAFWVMGTEYEALKLWREAADAYWELATRFPETDYEAWFKAAQVLDRRLGAAERALEAYARVRDGSPHYPEAQKRIAKLAR